MPTLSVILVNYKRVHDTMDCVRSLEQSIFKDFEIIIVDNGSGDGSADTLRHQYPEVTLLAMDNNLGFAEGNNVGIRQALHRGSKQILLLNNDTIVDKNALGVLSEYLTAFPSAGVAGAKIYYFNHPAMLWFAGGYINPNSASYGHRGIGERDMGQYDLVWECDYVSGCCLAFRREVVEKIGPLERSYFAYLEDADFCIRVRRAGYKAMYLPKAIVYHKVSTTAAWDSPTYIYFNLRNKLILLRRHSSFTQWLPYLPRLVYYYLRQFIRLIFKWHDTRKTRAAWYGLVDGLRNRTGENGEGRMMEIVR